MWISKNKHRNEIVRLKNEQMLERIDAISEFQQEADIEKLKKDVKKLKAQIKKLKKIVKEGY